MQNTISECASDRHRPAELRARSGQFAISGLYKNQPNAKNYSELCVFRKDAMIRYLHQLAYQNHNHASFNCFDVRGFGLGDPKLNARPAVYATIEIE